MPERRQPSRDCILRTRLHAHVPPLTFTSFPFAPTMEGQHILKNLVLISTAIVIGATMRGGRLTAQPSAPGCCACKGACRCKALE